MQAWARSGGVTAYPAVYCKVMHPAFRGTAYPLITSCVGVKKYPIRVAEVLTAAMPGGAGGEVVSGGIVRPSTTTRLTALTGNAANWYRTSLGPSAFPVPSRTSIQSCRAICRLSHV